MNEVFMLSGLTCGLIGYACLVLFDLNLLSRNNDRLETLYSLGGGFLLLGILQDLPNGKPTLPMAVRIVTGVLAVAFLVLIFYTCFLYGTRSKWRKAEREDRTHPWYDRKLNDKGIFALCRHPVVWLNVLFFLCLRAATGYPYVQTILFSVLGFVLALVEDRIFLPRTIPGYAQYKTTTPFLFPNRRSVARCRETWNQK